MNPLDPDERRLRFDVLNLAHRLHTDGFHDDGDDITDTAGKLMAFVDSQETVAA